MKRDEIRMGKRVWFRDPRYSPQRGSLYDGASGDDVTDDFIAYIDDQHGHETHCLMERTRAWVYISRLFETEAEARRAVFPAVPADQIDARQEEHRAQQRCVYDGASRGSEANPYVEYNLGISEEQRFERVPLVKAQEGEEEMLRYTILADYSPFRGQTKPRRTSSWKRARLWQRLWVKRHPCGMAVIRDEAPHLPMPAEQRRCHKRLYGKAA